MTTTTPSHDRPQAGSPVGRVPGPRPASAEHTGPVAVAEPREAPGAGTPMSVGARMARWSRVAPVVLRPRPAPVAVPLPRHDTAGAPVPRQHEPAAAPPLPRRMPTTLAPLQDGPAAAPLPGPRPATLLPPRHEPTPTPRPRPTALLPRQPETTAASLPGPRPAALLPPRPEPTAAPQPRSTALARQPQEPPTRTRRARAAAIAVPRRRWLASVDALTAALSLCAVGAFGAVVAVSAVAASTDPGAAAPAAPAASVSPNVSVPGRVLTTVKDGVWQVGVDVEPGTYTSAGAIEGATCSYTLRAARTGGAVTTSGITLSRTTVALAETDGWFATAGCAAWTRVA